MLEVTYNTLKKPVLKGCVYYLLFLKKKKKKKN